MLRRALWVASVIGASQAYAVNCGLYLGVNAGPSINGASNRQAQVEGAPPTTTTATPDSTQYGTKIMLGYMFTPFLGIESSATYFSTINYDTKVTTCASTDVRVRDFELSGKGVIPIRQFNVFGKAGVAAAYQAASSTFYPDGQDDCGKSHYSTNIVPALGAGVSYDLSRSWVADFSATNVAVGGKIGNMTLFGLGISYFFRDA